MSISHFRDRFRQILGIKEPPHRIAMAFSIGVFIGMSPLLGLHTILGLIAAWMFKLNKVVTVVGVYVTNPWTIVPIYTFGIWIGAKIVGMSDLIPDIDWTHISMKEFVHALGPLLVPFLIGTTFLGLISAFLSYVVVIKAVRKYHE